MYRSIRAFTASVAVVLASVALADVAAGATSVTATISGGVVTVRGTDGPDTIGVGLRSGNTNIIEIDVGSDFVPEFLFDRAQVTSIVVRGGKGDDFLLMRPGSYGLSETIPTTLDGGAGNDTLRGGTGPETLLGSTGNDDLDGNQAADVVRAGSGNDVVNWDPGEGSDVLDAGTGNDRLVFNGSSANEVFSLSANGSHARLTRNVATIAVDLPGFEIVDLRTFGGADVVSMTSLAGTGTKSVTVDLALFGGGDDGAADTVVVPSTSSIGRDGAVATVGGLGASLRVSNGTALDSIKLLGTDGNDVASLRGTSAPDLVSVYADGAEVAVFGILPVMHVRLNTVERLDVDLFSGDDQLGALGNLAALVTLDVDGGYGKDTLLGSNGNDVLAGGPGNDLVDGNQGADTLDGGTGADLVRWDPGDGSDTVVGGDGTDQLLLIGSSATEVFGVGPVGDHVRVTRNVGSVVHDLDAVEVVDIRASSATDAVVVDDVTGTDLNRVAVDLAPVGFANPDFVADIVTVNGTPGDDVISVVETAAGLQVQGLQATVDVTHADALIDRLAVNGLDGADTVTATPGSYSRMVVELAP